MSNKLVREMEKKLAQTPTGEIFSFVNVIKKVSDIQRFRKWLQTRKIDENDVFEGYKFFLTTSSKCLLQSIIHDTSLGLKDDYVFFRANFIGLPIKDIPNTCEKTIFIKNLWNIFAKISKARNWNELESILDEILEIIKIFDEIYDNCVDSTINLNKDEALRVLTMYYTMIFLNDTNRGIPHGFQLPSIIKLKVSPKYLKIVFKGYVYTLQYLWSELLGNDFDNYCVKDLHRAPQLYSKEADKLLSLEFKMMSKRKLTKKEKQLIEDTKDWVALDRFFGRINSEIVGPLEKKLKISLMIDPLLVINKNFDKSKLDKLLDVSKLKEPEYLQKSDKKSLEKRLDYFFLWYELEVLDTQKLTVFNGVPAFISTLLGSVRMKGNFEEGEKIQVRRIKHPVPGVDGFDYSYAILIQAYGSTGITDYSGWLLFYDCAGDYSGFSGSLHYMAESTIELLEKQDLIEVKEMVVDKELFENYIAKKSISPVFDQIVRQYPTTKIRLSLSELQKRVGDFIGHSKGKLFEYICYILLQDVYDKLASDFDIHGEQIDLVGERKREIHVFECKSNLHGDEIRDTLEQIKRKIKVIKENSNEFKEKTGIEIEEKNIIPHLIVFSPISNKRKRIIESEEIKVIDNFRDKIMNSRKLSKAGKKEIIRIFEYQFKHFF